MPCVHCSVRRQRSSHENSIVVVVVVVQSTQSTSSADAPPPPPPEFVCVCVCAARDAFAAEQSRALSRHAASSSSYSATCSRPAVSLTVSWLRSAPPRSYKRSSLTTVSCNARCTKLMKCDISAHNFTKLFARNRTGSQENNAKRIRVTASHEDGDKISQENSYSMQQTEVNRTSCGNL